MPCIPPVFDYLGMFYSQDLLCKRGHHFGTIWLLATMGERSRWRRITANELSSIDIPAACQDLLAPRAPMALRLTSTLLIGLVRALQRKAMLLYTDCHSTWVRVLSTPWVIDQQHDTTWNATTATTTLQDVRPITLPDVTVPTYIDSHGSIDMQLAIIGAEGSWNEVSAQKTVKRLRELGWIKSVDVDFKDSKFDHNARTAPHTSDWASISLPDVQVPRSGSVDCNRSTSSRSNSILDPLLLAADDGSGGMDDDFEHLLFDAEVPVHFDDGGNIQFIARPGSGAAAKPQRSHTGTTATSARTEMYFLSQIPTEGLIRNVTPGQLGGVLQCLDPTDHAALKFGDADPILHTPAAEADDRVLEEVENSILCDWDSGDSRDAATDPDRLPKRRRLNSNMPNGCLLAQQLAATYQARVTDLWGNTCYWQAAQRSKVMARVAERKRVNLEHRISLVVAAATSAGRLSVFSGLLGEAAHDGDMHIAMPSSSPKPSIDAGLDYGSIVSDEHFELEMGRGQSPSEVARRMFEREEEELQLHNIELDIPWLNPGADEMARRRVSVSMRTESSPGVGSQHGRSHAASVQSTPSRLSSLDPPSADELEVQEFELTADMPAAHRDIGAGDDGDDDLDGFLDIRNAGSEPDMPNDDSRKFYHFVVSRISRAGTAQFGDLVQAPHNKRRVAARAFMDLLQMATRSVLHVYQASPYSGIEISIEKEKNGWK